MKPERIYDICGRSENALPPYSDDTPLLHVDEDGFWLCADCQKAVKSTPVSECEEGELIEELKSLVGKSAGTICYTLDLPYVPPYAYVIDDANKIAYAEDRVMSEWTFIAQWLDNSTVWLSPERDQVALVCPDGSVVIRDR
jgi:hypothetical protein